MKEKKCECGNYFIPYIGGQVRCVHCILKEEPPTPPENLDVDSSAFAEWFIYHWHNIRKSAAKAKRKRFVYDDGIVGKEITVQKQEKTQSLAEMARQHGQQPRTVTARLKRGWTLEEALEGKRRK